MCKGINPRHQGSFWRPNKSLFREPLLPFDILVYCTEPGELQTDARCANASCPGAVDVLQRRYSIESAYVDRLGAWLEHRYRYRPQWHIVAQWHTVNSLVP